MHAASEETHLDFYEVKLSVIATNKIEHMLAVLPAEKRLMWKQVFKNVI